MSKRFQDEAPPKNRWEGKGKAPSHIIIRGKRYPVKYLSMWYKMLWVKYLDENPELVAYASQFDDFNNHFGAKAMNCQADVIRQYIKEGRSSIMQECKEFLELLKRDFPNKK